MEDKIHKDFHGGLSTGFQYLAEKYGQKDIEEYLELCAENMYGRLAEDIGKKGLSSLEKHWKRIFSLEGGVYEIRKKDDEEITLIVTECPALAHMKKAGYAIYGDFCVQCRIINEALARKTGLRSEVKSEQNKARCSQTFRRK